jgi:hypothetical protein
LLALCSKPQPGGVSILVAFYDMHGLQWDYSFPRSPHGDYVNKVKVKLSLCLTKHHAMKTDRGVTSALDEGEWSASCPCRFTPRERIPGTHWIGGWVSHYTHTDSYPSKTKHNITKYREKCLQTGDVGWAKPYAQCTSKDTGTVLSS